MGIHTLVLDRECCQASKHLHGVLRGLYFRYSYDVPVKTIVTVTQEVEGCRVPLLVKSGADSGMFRPLVPTVTPKGVPNPSQDVLPYIGGRLHFHADDLTSGSVCIHIFIEED